MGGRRGARNAGPHRRRRSARPGHRPATAALVVVAVLSVGPVPGGPPSGAAPPPRYQLPWAAGDTWHVTQGRHAETAWDLQPTPGTRTSYDTEVLAVAEGTARVSCDVAGQATVDLNVEGRLFRYKHLESGAVAAAGLTAAARPVRGGQVLGRLHPDLPEVTDLTCGYGTGSHLHLILPSLPLTLDGVTFSADGGPDREDLLRSTNAPPTGPPPPAPSRTGSDFDADGADDVLWYGPGSAPDAVGWGATAGTTLTAAPAMGGTATPLAGDFNGDGADDVLWYGPGAAPDSLWTGTVGRRSFTTGIPKTVNGTYTPFTGDFDGDGADDVFWYGPGSAPDALWFGTAGGTLFEPVPVATDLVATPLAADFDGDGATDVLWYGPGAAPDSLWTGHEGRRSFDPGPAVTVGGTYTPFTGDFDADGADDVFWYGPGGRPDHVWYGSGSPGAFQGRALTVSGTYVPVAGDLTGDGATDVLWYGPGAAPDAAWTGTPGGRRFGNGVGADVATLFTPVANTSPGLAEAHRPFPTWDDLVVRQLGDLTGSTGTAAGRTAVVARLASGSATPAAFVDEQLHGPWTADAHAPVARLYRAYFGRLPDHTGQTYWAARLRAGASLDLVSEHFARSAELTARYGALSDGDFVELVYRSVLDRDPDAPGRTYWVARLASGWSRGRLMTGFSESPENRVRTQAWVDVALVHEVLLGRAATGAEVLRSVGAPLQTLIADVLASAEYARRVG